MGQRLLCLLAVASLAAAVAPKISTDNGSLVLLADNVTIVSGNTTLAADQLATKSIVAQQLSTKASVDAVAGVQTFASRVNESVSSLSARVDGLVLQKGDLGPTGEVACPS
jgi:lipopolysaccharide export system protein LptA